MGTDPDDEQHPEYPGLTIEEDLGVQRRHWRNERIAWLLMALFIAAGALGLVGGRGVLSDTRKAAGSLAVEYQRQLRWQAGSTLSVRFGPDAAGPATVWVGDGLLDALAVESVSPAPETTEIRGDGHLLTFDSLAGEGGVVRFSTRPRRLGPVRGLVGRSRDSATPIDLFVLP